MRDISCEQIKLAVKQLCIDANYHLGEDMTSAFKRALSTEDSEIGKDVLQQLIDNSEIASKEMIPMCQDTGMAVFMVELGQDCHIADGNLYDSVNEGIRLGYSEGYLRSSVVSDPIIRKNTGDNTPGIIHVELVPGDHLTIHMTAKGFGSENMSRLQMLKPADGLDGVKDFIIDTVKLAGPNACPPMTVGIGIGGNFEMAAYLAKKSLFRKIGERNPQPHIAEIELELIQTINTLRIGPQGLGGRTTALDVHIETYPTHIAGLPVAVNINCHASRHKAAVL